MRRCRGFGSTERASTRSEAAWADRRRLLLVARHPHLLAGAAAMDSVTDLSRRYCQLADLPCDRRCLKRWGMPTGSILQSAMRREVGGTPEANPRAYASSEPAQLGASRSRTPASRFRSGGARTDRIVFDQKHQSRALSASSAA